MHMCAASLAPPRAATSPARHSSLPGMRARPRLARTAARAECHDSAPNKVGAGSRGFKGCRFGARCAAGRRLHRYVVDVTRQGARSTVQGRRAPAWGPQVDIKHAAKRGAAGMHHSCARASSQRRRACAPLPSLEGAVPTACGRSDEVRACGLPEQARALPLKEDQPPKGVDNSYVGLAAGSSSGQAHEGRVVHLGSLGGMQPVTGGGVQ